MRRAILPPTSLSSAAASYTPLVSVASQQYPANKLVVPLQPDMSYLVWRIWAFLQ